MGKRFGKLVVLHAARNDKGKTAWVCSCDCGNATTVLATDLKIGKVRSCGCINKEILKSLSEYGTNIASIASGTIKKNNKSGIKGIYFDKARNKWVAEIMFKRKKYHLGRFADKTEAADARKRGRG